MPAAWIKMVEVADLDPAKWYFIAGRPHNDMAPPMFQTMAGRKGNWSTKPGIAARYRGADLAKSLKDRPDLVAVEVPADADTRWKARTLTRRNPFR